MKKTIKYLSEDKKTMQITCEDERFYVKPDEKTGQDVFYPSVTWICGHYPKGVAFYKWLANHGWDESEALKQAAGDKGSKVHSAIVDLIDGNEVAMNMQYPNPTTGNLEELALEEYECLLSFVNWFKEVKLLIITREVVVFNEEFHYAGTVDLLCQINGVTWLIDFKTGQYIWPEYELQVSAYRHALMHHKALKLGILQVGYRLNKKKFKFTEIDDKFDLFQSAYRIWQNEQEGVEPKKIDLPTSLKLEIQQKGE